MPSSRIVRGASASTAPFHTARSIGATSVIGIDISPARRKLAEDLRDELLGRAWVEREAFVYKIEPLQQSVARAKAMPPGRSGDGPIVLLDHYDNCASGGRRIDLETMSRSAASAS